MPWTDEERMIGEKFLGACKNFDGTFVQKKDPAARSIGFHEGYKGMPKGSRSYVAHVGQVAKKKRQLEKAYKKIREQLDTNIKLQKMLEEWWEIYQTNPDFRHAMTHPDDE